MDSESIEGTIVEKRIMEKCVKGKAQKSIYKMKSKSTSLNRNINEYTDEQIELMKVELRDYLYFFGYTNHPELEHHTTFFEYSEHDGVDLANWKAFNSWNDKIL